MNYKIGILTEDGLVGVYTGYSLDDDLKKAQAYPDKIVPKRIMRRLSKRKEIKNVYLYTGTRTERQLRKLLTGMDAEQIKKNPAQNDKNRKIKKAEDLYEEFTGQEVNEHVIIENQNYDVALKVGKCLGIMYETVRDGRIEKYIHKFKKASQPDLAISWDGQQIIILGGAYLFKDSGINDE